MSMHQQSSCNIALPTAARVKLQLWRLRRQASAGRQRAFVSGIVADPRLWPLSLHGSQGILGAPSHGLLEQARTLRNTLLDPQSRFGRVFAGSSRLQAWEPLANGGRLLGGIDPDTGITYGFDPLTGAPDRGRQMTEAEIYAGMAQSLGVSLDGVTLPDMRAMRRSA